jgi:hypothetical protein
MGTASFPEVKRPGRDVDHPPPYSAEVKERVELYLYIWAFVACYRVNFTFIYLFLFGATAPNGSGLPHSRGFLITHNDAPQSVGLLWTSGQLVAETST